MAAAPDRLRLNELLATLSLATDLGTGQPLGHGLRSSLVAIALGRELGCGPDQLRSVQQVALLRFLGCTSDAGETAQMVGGDEITFNAVMAPAVSGSAGEALRAMTRAVGPGHPPRRRAGLLVGVLADPGGDRRIFSNHCEVAAMLATRLGLIAPVVQALAHAFERWDGKGHPEGLAAEEIPLEVRISTVARDVDLFIRRGDDVNAVLQHRRGKAYDPAVVDAYRWLGVSHPEADWDQVMEAEPAPFACVDDPDDALAVVADFADLKSRWTRGHSPRVAEIVGAAAQTWGLGADESRDLRRAALVHDVGRVGVENGVWDKPGQLSVDEWEKVTTHPYLTHRVLARCPALSPLGELASSHHERLDGSGYHRQASADQISSGARILAAADVLCALTSPRPHRPAFEKDAAIATLRAAVDAGTMDGDAVACVVSAAGGEFERRRTPNPGGLTDREVEVLVTLASGSTNREVAAQLFISPKTVGRHVENIYAKIGVSTRAGAAVFAMQHRLLG
ncbi:HD domain-containing protein [soil metagenome]